ERRRLRAARLHERSLDPEIHDERTPCEALAIPTMARVDDYGIGCQLVPDGPAGAPTLPRRRPHLPTGAGWGLGHAVPASGVAGGGSLGVGTDAKTRALGIAKIRSGALAKIARRAHSRSDPARRRPRPQGRERWSRRGARPDDRRRPGVARAGHRVHVGPG